MNNIQQAFAYRTAQVQLACLDTLVGDHTEYARALAFKSASSLDAIIQMFGANGDLAFETRERETSEETWERLRAPVETFRGREVAV